MLSCPMTSNQTLRLNSEKVVSKYIYYNYTHYGSYQFQDDYRRYMLKLEMHIYAYIILSIIINNE